MIDTHWVIDYLHDVARVTERFAELSSDELGISVIWYAEFYEGVYLSVDPEGDERILLDFLVDIPLVMLDEDTCRIFARQRGRLRRTGRMIGDLDLLTDVAYQ